MSELTLPQKGTLNELVETTQELTARFMHAKHSLKPGQVSNLDWVDRAPLFEDREYKDLTLEEEPFVNRAACDHYPSESGFRYFMDGTSKVWEVTWDDSSGIPVPLFLGVYGAAITERRDRRLDLLYVAMHYCYLGHFTYLDKDLVRFLGGNMDVQDADKQNSPTIRNIAIQRRRDTSDEEPEIKEAVIPPYAIPDMRAQAYREIKGLREQSERHMAQWFEKEHSGERLVCDGSVRRGFDAPGARLIGITKTHRRRMLPPEHHMEVMKLRPYERSALFSVDPYKRDGSQSSHHWAHNFYLRLQEPVNPLFGLVRVDFRYGKRRPAPPSPEQVDELARWVLAETAPTIYPEKRWDIEIYPIAGTESYLHALLPSDQQIMALWGNVYAYRR